MMNLIKWIVLSTVLAMTACLNPQEAPPAADLAADVAAESAPGGDPAPLSLAAPGGDNAAACVGDVTCPAQFTNCTFLGDFDCGEEFCRTPGEQCGGQPSTFIRVSHVSQCTDAAGNICIAVRQGRRLVHCGC